MGRGKISIIVPIYKVEDELPKCIESLLNQTYKDIEIILVDDGSPDKCPQICDLYAKNFCEIIVIHKANGGLSDARNKGLIMATGDYVLYVDADDYIEPDSCEKLIQGMVENVDFVVGAYKEKYGDEIRYQRHTNIQEKKVYTAKDFVIASINKNEWYAPAWLNLYNRKFLLDNQLFYKVGSLFEDHQILLRLFLAAQYVVYIDYPFYNYIIRKNSIMMSENSPQKIKITIDNYSEWMETISTVVDKEFQRYLYGILIRYYLRSCRVRKIYKWKIEKMNWRFALKYALGFKEQIKVILFTIAPRLYVFRLKLS